MAEQDYRRSAALSKSDLDWIHPPRTPAHFKAHIDGLVPREETDALRFGSLLHRVLLEPDTIDGRIAVKPEGMKFSTKDGKAWRDEQDDKVIVTAAEDKTLRSMIAALWTHPVAKRILAHSDRERALFVDDDGMMLKGRLDLLPHSGNAIYDIKTVEDGDDHSFSKAIANYGYHRQAGHYLRLAAKLGMAFDTFAFIVCEKNPPYAVALYALDDVSTEYGRRTILRDIALVRHCREHDHWPGYSEGVETITLPPWLMREAEQAA